MRHDQLEHLERCWSQADTASWYFSFFSPTLTVFFFLVYCTLLMTVRVVNQIFGTKVLTHRFDCFCEMQSHVRDSGRAKKRCKLEREKNLRAQSEGKFRKFYTSN